MKIRTTKGACAWAAMTAVVALTLGASGCASDALAYAPRTAEAEPPPKPRKQVRLVEVGVPECHYEVIGSAFGSSLDRLVDVAAAHGGDGIYDAGCRLEEGGTVMHTNVGDIDTRHTNRYCDGRVYVCRGPLVSTADRAKHPAADGGSQ